MFDNESPKLEKTLKERIKYAAKNLDKLSDFELRELYNEISIKKMQKKISRKARIINIKEKHEVRVTKRKDKKVKKQHLKEEIQKLKEKINKEENKNGM